MSSDETTPHTRHDRASDAAAYALGALTPQEAEEFRRHLDGCRACQAEVAAFERVVDLLPMAAPQQEFPARARRRVLAEVRGARGRRPRRWSIGASRPILALATVILIAVVAAGALISTSGGSGGPRVLPAQVMHSPGTASLRLSGDHAELIVRHLPPPPPGRIYEVWLKRSTPVPTPAGALFTVDARGAADVGVPGDVQGVSAILVTAEPGGGSRVPSRQPLIVAPTS